MRKLFRGFHRHRWGSWEPVTVQFWDEDEPMGAETRQRCRCTTCGRYKMRKIGRR